MPEEPGVSFARRGIAATALVLTLAACDSGKASPRTELDLSAAARSDAAASALLLDADRRDALLRGEGDATGSAQVLSRGTTPAGTDDQAEAALAVIRAVGAKKLPEEMPEEISDQILDVGLVWMGQFGRGGKQDVAAAQGDGFTMSPSTESGFLRFVASTTDGDDDSDPVRFHAAATLDTQADISQAFAADSTASGALRRSGLLDGEITDADIATLSGGGRKDPTRVAVNAAASRSWQSASLAAGLVATGATVDDLTTLRIDKALAASKPGGPPNFAQQNKDRAVSAMLELLRFDATSREFRTVVNAALQAKLPVPVSASDDEFVVQGEVRQIEPGIRAQALETMYDSVKDEYDIAEGGYRDAWIASFVPR